MQAANGGWHVAFANYRGEMIAVMECATFAAAYAEAAAMTLDSVKRAICGAEVGAVPKVKEGNRYLRAFA